VSDRRTALARVRGLGSARAGVGHWWTQRVTALLLIPLLIWFVAALLAHTGADRTAVADWLHRPVTYGLMLVLLGSAFWHAGLGLQVVIEDYVHDEALRLAMVLLAKGACLGLFVAGFVALTTIVAAG
jgi:succinate dehydrogenase / fumarate reductase, membrane anchor subunit